ncbi:MAG: hypothetical protein QXS69_01030, partial [Candidatus Aenigmatarchaeota archaeon]
AMLAIIIGISIIGIASYWHALMITQIEFLNLVALGFLVAIFSGCLYFLGYIFARSSKTLKYSKTLFNISAIVAFVGIFIVELLVFSQYVSVSRYPLEDCNEKKINFFEVQSFLLCVLTGKTITGEGSQSWTLVSFVIFGMILPFSVLFSIVFGLFHGMGLDALFGKKYGKAVIGVIAFATAFFGTRQLIGIFLIDLLAYGAWGIFGFIIALFFSSAIKFTANEFLKDIKEIEEEIKVTFS